VGVVDGVLADLDVQMDPLQTNIKEIYYIHTGT
jgi:hypothetical protein